MADYSQQDRYYAPHAPRPPNQRPPPQNYPPRDAAYANIFGGAPPPGRSHTMGYETQQMMQDRNPSMNSQGGMPMRPPPPRQMGGPPFDRVNGTALAPPHMNGMNAGRPPPPNHAPDFPDRKPYPAPQRIETMPGGMQGGPPMGPYQRKPIPNRVPPAALNNDPYRSRSMVPSAQPAMHSRPPPPSSFQQGTARDFRQQPYAPMGARTTSQGRAIPERMGEDRAMTMGSYSSTDRDHMQLTSGRIVPGRRRESGSDPFSDQHAASATFTSTTTAPSSTREHPPRPRRTSDSSQPTRQVSAASAISTTSAASGVSDASTLVNGTRSDSMRHPRPPPAAVAGSSSATTTTLAQRKSPLVYPALLSRVAFAFQERIGVGDRSKNELAYKNAFTGAEAVDLIAYIIKTTDRNLALLLGRALDAQKFFPRRHLRTSPPRCSNGDLSV